MKKILFIISILVLTLLHANTLPAQSETTMQDIVQSVSDKITELEEQKDQELVNITIDLLGGDNKKTFTRYLDPAFDYTVIALGDRRISKLRMIVQKMSGSNWEYVSEVSGSAPDIKITPPEYVMYSFTVNVDKFVPDKTTGHYAVLIYHKDPLKK